jgi:hypothetical protein
MSIELFAETIFICAGAPAAFCNSRFETDACRPRAVVFGRRLAELAMEWPFLERGKQSQFEAAGGERFNDSTI